MRPDVRRRANSSARRRRKLGPAGFGCMAATADIIAIVVAAVISGAIDNLATVGAIRGVATATAVGLVVAMLIVLVSVQAGGYAQRNYFSMKGQASRVFGLWNWTFLAALAAGFATRAASDFPRGAIGIFYLSGLLLIVVARWGIVRVQAQLRRVRFALPRRVVAVGFENELNHLHARVGSEEEGVEIVSMFALRQNDAYFSDDLTLACAAVRWQRPDDVFIALPWSRPDLIEASLDVLVRLPTEVHLLVEGFIDRFGEAHIARVGSASGITVKRAPLTILDRLGKRIFDIATAALALALLAPLLAVVAVLIRFEGPGPVMFRQTRYGFNQEPFRIFKFRSMRTMEDGANVVQATRNDARVTRIGAFLRRSSIDELPQLLNVLRGDMSMVGPRPHAMAHDQLYVDKLARYARRHNVKPGITGWAQVRGHRGEIAHDAGMQARLEHDLYYIDNWSLWLDIKIIMLTVFSRKARANAY